MSRAPLTPVGLDALPPPAMARRAEEVGVAKARMDAGTTFVLAVLAGAFIAMGAIFATTTTAVASETRPPSTATTLEARTMKEVCSSPAAEASSVACWAG